MTQWMSARLLSSGEAGSKPKINPIDCILLHFIIIFICKDPCKIKKIVIFS